MKYYSHLMLFVSAVMLALSACSPKVEEPTAEVPGDTIPSDTIPALDTFERTLLLEHFTSEACLNCPNGVAQIEEWLKNHPNVIWLSHHAGYKDDPWTITDSKKIANLLGVSGAPIVALNRSLMVAGSLSGYNLHPFYLEELTELPSTTTTASIRIDNIYADGKLRIHVAGQIKEEEPSPLRLSVVIKESGLHGQQMDPDNTLAGMWSDYVHANAIRTYVSSAAGDSIVPDSSAYEKDYELDWNSNWIPENCMVVAFLTDNKSLNVVQAAEQPVVAGTKGGNDLPHGGVTPKAVPEGYPEGKYSLKDFLKADEVILHNVRFGLPTLLPNGIKEWILETWTTEQSYNKNYIPFASIIFYTDASVTEVPESGVFPFTIARTLDEIVPGTAWAGYCDLEAQKIIGSQVMLVSKAALEAGYIDIGNNAHWLIQSGTLTLRPDGLDVVATSATGKAIRMVFNSAKE